MRSNYIRLFIGDIKRNNSKEEIISKLSKTCQIANVDFKKNRKSQNMMVFFDISSAEAARKLLMRPFRLKGVEYYCQRSQHAFSSMELGIEERGIHVSNLPKEMKDSSMRHFFTKFGDVETCFSIKKHNGQSRGYGFVYFRTADAAQYLIQKKKISINGKYMIIKCFEQKQKHGSKLKGRKQKSESWKSKPSKKKQAVAGGNYQYERKQKTSLVHPPTYHNLDAYNQQPPQRRKTRSIQLTLVKKESSLNYALSLSRFGDIVNNQSFDNLRLNYPISKR